MVKHFSRLPDALLAQLSCTRTMRLRDVMRLAVRALTFWHVRVGCDRRQVPASTRRSTQSFQSCLCAGQVRKSPNRCAACCIKFMAIGDTYVCDAQGA